MFQKAHKNSNAKPSLASHQEMNARQRTRKTRPILRDIQNTVAMQVGESRRYVALQTDPSSLSPTYPAFDRPAFDRAQIYSTHASMVAMLCSPPASVSSCSSSREDCSVLHVRASAQIQSPRRSSSLIVSRSLDSLLSLVSDTHIEAANTSWSTTASRWGSSEEFHDYTHADPPPLVPTAPTRSFTPLISPPTISLPPAHTGYPSKRSGRTFALVPAEVDGKHVFSHVVVGQHGVRRGGSASAELSTTVGLPEDMKDTLRQLDELACWVKAASLSRISIDAIKEILDTARLTGQPEDPCVSYTGHPTSRPLPNKGKTRLLSASPSEGELDSREDLIKPLKGAVPRNSTFRSGDVHFRSEGFIYEPNRNTPEFLVGSSSSPIAYPVHGYSSHPSRYSPCGQLPGSTHAITYHRRFLSPRSAPCPPASTPLVTPPSGKTTFMGFFQRSTTATRSSLPLSRGPTESTIRRGKRMRLPWLRI